MNGILREKEASLKKRLTAERDQQLEMVIGRLGEETHSSQKLLLAKFDRERDALVSEHVGEATRLRGQITALRAERDEVACKADELDRKLKGLSSKILTTEHDLDAKDKDGQQVRARARAAEAKLADLQLVSPPFAFLFLIPYNPLQYILSLPLSTAFACFHLFVCRLCPSAVFAACYRLAAAGDVVSCRRWRPTVFNACVMCHV